MPAPLGPGGADRVLLVSMPFGPVERPSLGLGLLQAHCQRMGIDCETRYATLMFAEWIGVADYRWVTDRVPYTAFAGDWVFAEALYGARADADDRYVQDTLRGHWLLDESDVDRLRGIRAAVPGFLDRCVEEIEWDRYTLVGFTSVFQQNLASLRSRPASSGATRTSLPLSVGPTGRTRWGRRSAGGSRSSIWRSAGRRIDRGRRSSSPAERGGRWRGSRE